MTKKKAIDRALKALPLSNHRFYREVLENLWTDARIAGLREASRIAERNPHRPEWIIDNKADALAKKARVSK